MYGNVIKSVKKNKTVQNIKEQNTKLFGKTQNKLFESPDKDLNKNTKSGNEDQHRKYTFYRQYTLQASRDGENSTRGSTRTKDEENVSAIELSNTKEQTESGNFFLNLCLEF